MKQVLKKRAEVGLTVRLHFTLGFKIAFTEKLCSSNNGGLM